MWVSEVLLVSIVFIATPNSALREGWYRKHLSELQAHQVFTAMGVLLVGIYTWALVHLWRPTSGRQAITIGLTWLGMTVAFEFLFGRYVAEKSWHQLLRDYNIFAGRVWLVILIWVTIAPYIFYQLQQ